MAQPPRRPGPQASQFQVDTFAEARRTRQAGLRRQWVGALLTAARRTIPPEDLPTFRETSAQILAADDAVGAFNQADLLPVLLWPSYHTSFAKELIAAPYSPPERFARSTVLKQFHATSVATEGDRPVALLVPAGHAGTLVLSRVEHQVVGYNVPLSYEWYAVQTFSAFVERVFPTPRKGVDV